MEAELMEPREGVVVATDHHLIGETVCAALESQGIASRLLVGWPVAVPARVPRPRTDDRQPARTLLVVCDLDVPGRLAEAREVGRRHQELGATAWLVLAAGERGAAWGAVLDAGARGVIGSEVRLRDLVRALEVTGEGGAPMDEVERQVLVRRWRAVRASPERLLRQLDHLSPQEGELLTLLYRGTALRSIAERFDISEAAVRGQVKAMLRRLSAPPGE